MPKRQAVKLNTSRVGGLLAGGQHIFIFVRLLVTGMYCIPLVVDRSIG